MVFLQLIWSCLFAESMPPAYQRLLLVSSTAMLSFVAKMYQLSDLNSLVKPLRDCNVSVCVWFPSLSDLVNFILILLKPSIPVCLLCHSYFMLHLSVLSLICICCVFYNYINIRLIPFWVLVMTIKYT